jgi:aspartyl-tRNA(Asn)/glutamyl-tRNA(Gln) amidotransferase subunit C
LSLTNDQVRHIAKLASIRLEDHEVEIAKKELNSIFGYIDQLQKIPTAGVVPTSHVHGVVNFFRDDVAGRSLPLEELEKNAPDFSRDGFRVPKIVG